MLLPSALDHYQLEIQENMLAKYQYMLSVPASAYSGNKADAMSSMEYYMDTRTDNKDGKIFCISLNTMPVVNIKVRRSLSMVWSRTASISVQIFREEGVYISVLVNSLMSQSLFWAKMGKFGSRRAIP